MAPGTVWLHNMMHLFQWKKKKKKKKLTDCCLLTNPSNITLTRWTLLYLVLIYVQKNNRVKKIEMIKLLICGCSFVFVCWSFDWQIIIECWRICVVCVCVLHSVRTITENRGERKKMENGKEKTSTSTFFSSSSSFFPLFFLSFGH